MQETESSLYCKVLWCSTTQGRGAAESSSGDGALQGKLVKGSYRCFLLFVIVNEGLESLPVVAKHQNSLLLT